MSTQALPKLTLAEARVLQDTENPVIHWRPDANIMDVGTQRTLGHVRYVPFHELPEDVHYAVVVPIVEPENGLTEVPVSGTLETHAG